VGATKCNLALFRQSGKDLSVIKESKYFTKDYSDPVTMISRFPGASKLPDNMSFGVAGPVQNGKVKITNLSWKIDSKEISIKFGNIPVHFINDLEATAYGLAALEKDDVYTIYEGAKGHAGNMALIAPGTGLGEAGLFWDGTVYHPFATKGGHCDFAPRTKLDVELYLHLQEKFNHVSWERLISGPGIFNIYEFLKTKKSREVPPWLAEKILAQDAATVISENAENASICEETMNFFFRYLATESANLALKVKATGGIFIGGGIIPKVLKLLDADLFLKCFRDFGRLKYLLQEISVNVILNERTALLGAAYYGTSTK